VLRKCCKNSRFAIVFIEFELDFVLIIDYYILWRETIVIFQPRCFCSFAIKEWSAFWLFQTVNSWYQNDLRKLWQTCWSEGSYSVVSHLILKQMPAIDVWHTVRWLIAVRYSNETWLWVGGCDTCLVECS